MLGWYHEQGVHGTQGRVCIEHRAGYAWNPGQGTLMGQSAQYD